MLRCCTATAAGPCNLWRAPQNLARTGGPAASGGGAGAEPPLPCMFEPCGAAPTSSPRPQRPKAPIGRVWGVNGAEQLEFPISLISPHGESHELPTLTHALSCVRLTSMRRNDMAAIHPTDAPSSPEGRTSRKSSGARLVSDVVHVSDVVQTTQFSGNHAARLLLLLPWVLSAAMPALQRCTFCTRPPSHRRCRSSTPAPAVNCTRSPR